MENQLIREQIFEELLDYVRKWDGIHTESDCATVRDEICLRIDQSQFTADEAEEHINLEVEKRIAERMLTDEDIIDFALLYVSHKSLLPANRGLIKDAIIIGMKELRSRLTNPGDSQKTEGGGE